MYIVYIYIYYLQFSIDYLQSKFTILFFSLLPIKKCKKNLEGKKKYGCIVHQNLRTVCLFQHEFRIKKRKKNLMIISIITNIYLYE